MPIASGITASSYLVTGLSVGSLYSFKIQARNIFGFSSFSDIVQILAAQIPDKPLAPTTTFDRTTVKITWAAPFEQGSPITGYQVFIKTSDSVTYYEDLTDCNRLSIPSLSCTIPILSLKTQPYTIPWGGHVYSKIIAINAYGYSEISEDGNGA